MDGGEERGEGAPGKDRHARDTGGIELGVDAALGVSLEGAEVAGVALGAVKAAVRGASRVVVAIRVIQVIQVVRPAVNVQRVPGLRLQAGKADVHIDAVVLGLDEGGKTGDRVVAGAVGDGGDESGDGLADRVLGWGRVSAAAP